MAFLVELRATLFEIRRFAHVRSGLLSMRTNNGAFAFIGFNTNDLAFTKGVIVATSSRLQFSDDRSEAIRLISSIASGKGWCNVAPVSVDDEPDLRVSTFGMRAGRGVPVASYVTSTPRHGEEQPSSLGILHSRGRLGRERITEMLGGAPFVIRQDHNQRGLLLDVPVGAPASQVLEVMCTLSESLCDFELTGNWHLDLFLRQ
jgi:hypothetical protein